MMKLILPLIFLFCMPAMQVLASPGHGPLAIHMERENITLRAGFRQTAAISIMPDSVEVGMDCGMPDMCGIDPCLCGSADAWGACSCNGLRTALPEVVIRAQPEGIVRAVYRGGTITFTGLKTGEATVTVTASLPRHTDVQRKFEITVTTFPAHLYIPAAVIIIAIALTVAFRTKLFSRTERQ